MSKFISFRDMFDGGGAGKSGDTFQGGGFLSELGNQFFKPAGYYDRVRNQYQTQIAPIPQTDLTTEAPRTIHMAQKPVRPVQRPQLPKEQPSENLPNKDSRVLPTIPSLPQDPSLPSLPREVVGRYGKTELPMEFNDYLDFLPDFRFNQPLQKLQEAYQNYVDLYSTYVKGLGPEADKYSNQDLYEGFRNLIQQYEK